MSKKVKIILAIVLLVVAFLGFQFYKAISGVLKYQPEATNVVTSFLTDVSKNDIDGAYNLISKDFKKEYTKEQLSKLFTTNKYLFSGFASQTQTTFKGIRSTEYPGTVYEYEGNVSYTDGYKGAVKAKLVQEDGMFKILYINVEADPKRIEKF